MLTTCSECNKEVSDKAIVCPHCGNPVVLDERTRTETEDTPIPQSPNRTSFLIKRIMVFLLLLFVFSGLYLWKQTEINEVINLLIRVVKYQYTGVDNILQEEKTSKNIADTASDKNKIPLQEINNLGTKFYIGEIEYASTTNITDDLKNKITKTVYEARVTKNTLEGNPIIVVNNLAYSTSQYIDVSGIKLTMPELNASFLYEGGVFVRYSNGKSLIIINKEVINKGQVAEVLTHEFGHALANTLDDQEWQTFYKLRNIPTGTPRQGSNWNLSPQEDFAEVYKNIYTSRDIRTYWGILKSAMDGTDECCTKIYEKLMNYNNDIIPTSFFSRRDDSKIITNAELQKCRRDVMTGYSKCDSPSGGFLISGYKSTVDQATKDFIAKVNID